MYSKLKLFKISIFIKESSPLYPKAATKYVLVVTHAKELHQVNIEDLH